MAACPFSLQNINVSIKSETAEPDQNRMKKFHQNLEDKASDKQAKTDFSLFYFLKKPFKLT